MVDILGVDQIRISGENKEVVGGNTYIISTCQTRAIKFHISSTSNLNLDRHMAAIILDIQQEFDGV